MVAAGAEASRPVALHGVEPGDAGQILTPSVDDFRLGRNFRVIELNGVRSDAAEIYDPAHGLLAKYALFLRQWRLAYEIGAANVARGARAWTFRELIRLVLTHLRRSRHPTRS